MYKTFKLDNCVKYFFINFTINNMLNTRVIFYQQIRREGELIFCVKSDTFAIIEIQNVSITGYTAKIPTFPYNQNEGQGRNRALPLNFFYERQVYSGNIHSYFRKTAEKNIHKLD